MSEPTSVEGSVTLVVDDDVAFCTALAAALRRRGQRVVVAHNKNEALREARAWKPERATVDLRLGEAFGIDLVKALRAEHPDIVIVVLTGFGSIATAVEAVKAGAQQYLTKPSSIDAILRAFDGETDAEGDAPPSLDEVEWEHLQRVLSECQGNVSEAARRLGLHRRTLQRKLARHR